MAIDIFWEPVLPQTKRSLSRDLKYILARTFWDTDGTVAGDPFELDESHLDYLRGIADAGNKEVAVDARTLIEAVRLYGRVRITWEA